MVEVGDTGPDFTLTGTRGEDISEFTLSEFAADRPAMLVFYIYDFSPVCTTQMCEINDMDMLTLNDEIAVLGISSDGPYSHREFIKDNEISYPLLTDRNEEVYEHYGMTDPDGRELKRGIVALDSDRTVRYVWRAADNWDKWEMHPMREAYDVLQDRR